MVVARMLPLLVLFGYALPGSAQVLESFPYEAVSAFGENNERDVNEGSCDLVLGCFDRNGAACADSPSQPCDLATVPAGRCVTGNRFENVWPSKSGECAGTLGYFERGPPILGNIQENTVAGIPCLADGYSAALAAFSVDPDRDDTQIVALESVNGPSSMCPGNGTCAMKKCVPIDASTGVVACVDTSDCPNLGDSCIQANDNSGNCQAFDARPSFCLSDPNVVCGIDADCPKTCSGGSQGGQPCTNTLLDCKNGIGTNPGDCVPIIGDCPLAGNDFERGVCGGTQARCSDADPDLEIGGLGLGFCIDTVISGQIDTSVDCGRNAGAPVRSSPRNVLENPLFLFTPQRDPGTGFLGVGPIRRVRSTSMARVQTAADASANTLGIRSVQIQGDTAWWDALFSADDVNGALDRVMLTLPCNPPEDWQTQLPVEGNCTPPNQGVFCIEDGDCPSGACENLLFCHERRDPNRPALGPALDSVGFLWQRDIVDNEPIPLGLPDAFRDPNGDPIWSTDPLAPSCPPLCGTAYDHTTFETEAISSVRAQDRASGFQLALDALGGPRAGRGHFLTLGSGTTVEFVNIGDIRCRIGGQDPSDLTDLGTCTSSGVPCDPDNPVVCAAGEACRACAGRLIRAGDPLEVTRGLNPSAVPLGYTDQGFDVLKLIENDRLGVLNGFPTTVKYSVFTLGTNGAAAASFTDAPPCIASGDRCVLGQTPAEQPGSVGIGAGGTFSDAERFAHGGANVAGTDVSWGPEDPPGVAEKAYVRAASIGVGPDGIPGCMGNNSPRNNASDACRKRLARGQETGLQDPMSTQGKWGFCQGGTQGWLPGPPPPCQTQTEFFSCQFPFGVDLDASCGTPTLGFNTGVDDPELLTPVEDPNAAVEATKGRFLVPDPDAPAPTLHWVGATTKRDLDLLGEIDNTDFVLKSDRTLCPVDPETGISICAGRCADLGGDTDRDGVCDAGGPNVCASGQTRNCRDNCPAVSNPDQTDTDGDEAGNACDPDDDSDGITDDDDNCPLLENPDQDDADTDGLGDVCDPCPINTANDADGDGVCEGTDNCPLVSNSNQADSDFDGQGDVCDPCPNDDADDADGDGFCADVDNCPVDENADQTDADGDGAGDVCDVCPDDADDDLDGDGVCGDADNCPLVENSDQTDTDSDGTGDVCDACPNDPDNDVDSDGVCGDVDNCPLDPNPDQQDSDGDELGDICDDTEIRGSLVLSRVRATSRFKPSGAAVGKVVIRGFLDVRPPLDGFLPSLEEGFDPNGDSPDEVVMLVRVHDDGALNLPLAFLRSECQLSATKIRCKSSDKTTKALLKELPSTPDVYRLSIRAKKLSIPLFETDRIQVTLTTGTTDRIDEIGDLAPCEIKHGPFQDKLDCLESGGP